MIRSRRRSCSRRLIWLKAAGQARGLTRDRSTGVLIRSTPRDSCQGLCAVERVVEAVKTDHVLQIAIVVLLLDLLISWA